MAADTTLWLAVIRRYALASVIGHIAWETLQLPLYTIWFEGSLSQIIFAVVHCTGGDVLIASAALLAALLVFGQGWPISFAAYRNTAAAAIVLGAGYTIFSEWLNVNVRASWAYGPWMPRLPPLGTGLAPLAQWLIVPGLAFVWARRCLDNRLT